MSEAVAAAEAANKEPWRRPWYWCQRGEWPTLAWVVGIHVAAVIGLIFLPLPPWPVFVIAGVLLTLGGLGTTVAYHRALAHKAVSLNPVVEQALIACAVGNGSGDPRTWVAAHRHHHRHSDTENDISSPMHGFWWSHLRWLWQAPAANHDTYAPDLKRARYRMWRYMQIPMLALSVGGGLLWAFADSWSVALAAMLWIGPIRLIWALHAQCAVNSVCHFGRREEHGTGQNLWWLSPLHLFQGENWHANHHRFPADARLGRRWWQVDVGWAVIRTLGAVGLAKRIRQHGD